MKHYSVMCQEVLEHLELKPGDRVLDCTVGGAGHSSAMLARIGPNGFLWGIERDPRTLSLAQETLTQTGYPFRLIHGNFAELSHYSQEYKIANLDAVLLDLGTSIFQLREAQRGFSFSSDGPLDMRMNPDEDRPSAAELVNHLSEAKLKEIFSTLGEERFSGRIASAIVKARLTQPIERTVQLAEIVAEAVPKRDKLHPATRVFQALRIAVNDELEAIRQVLPVAVSLLKPGGKIAVIAFHSLEDRIVKQSFRQMSQDCICPPRQPICNCQHQALLARSGKAMTPSEQEIRENSPSRSAKLRIARRLTQVSEL